MAKNIDKATCFKESLPDWPIDYDMQLKLHTNTLTNDIAWKTLAPAVFDHVRSTGTLWKSWTQKGKAWEAAQLIFDKVNLARLKQSYATACLKQVSEHRKLALGLKSQFPDVGDQAQ